MENISELKSRGVDPSEPEPQYISVNGSYIKVWTNVMLNGLEKDDYIVYLVEYTPEEALQLSERRPAPEPVGGIGLLSVKEIVVGTADINRTRDAWQRFLSPSSHANATAPYVWQIGEGPAIRLVLDERDGIKSMVWMVESLDKARAFLEAAGMLGESSSKELTIDPAKVENLDIRLVEG
jgi:hypothetical protein